jgi:elongation factor Ts
VAASEQFVAEADELAKLVRTKGVAAVGERAKQLEDLQILLKEKIELGEVVRFEAAAGNIMDSYLHLQGGRGVNVVLVEMSGASEELAHDIAVHIAFARPKYLTRDEVPAEVVAAERATLEVATRNEGKPEAAIAKIVDGKLNGFFKDLCLLEQPYAKDDKKSVKQVIGSASIVRFTQVEIG